jgi:phospholipid/cholesterol/gamma-HCH transport system substrate-binding protein
VFQATASQNEALAETFRIFPTFLDESRSTLRRLQVFAVDTNPLINDLRPVARDLKPTLRDVRALAPDLRKLFRDLDPLIAVSKKGLPALRDTLRAARPLLDRTGLFLRELNPILELLEYYQPQVRDFITNGSFGQADTVERPGATGHYLRQNGPQGAETVGIFRERSPLNRGNAYLPPLFAAGPEISKRAMYPNWDCNHIGGPRDRSTQRPPTAPPNVPGTPACWIAPTIPYKGTNQRFPHIVSANY